jgi:hypothetical protein
MFSIECVLCLYLQAKRPLACGYKPSLRGLNLQATQTYLSTTTDEQMCECTQTLGKMRNAFHRACGMSFE